jgi:outer membrane receptor protein involved in Fe transport
MANQGKSALSVLVSALMAGTAFIPVSAQAQEASASANSAGDAIPDIIVTAQKRSQSINDVGLTITALGSDTLERQGIKTLDDLAKSVPGLSYAGTDFGTPVFTLRGVGFYDRSLAGYPTTSVYVDEMPLPLPVMTAHANLDLERIEVLKGPQGTLFGQNSTGGAINYIAAKPTDAFAAGVDVTLGRFGAGEANGYISGPITETLGVRLAGQYGYGSPWQRSYTRDDSVGRKNLLNGRLLVHWEPTPALRVALNLNGWRDTSDPQAAQYFATFPQVNSPGGVAVDPILRTYPFTPSDPRAADWSVDHRPAAYKRQYQAALRADLDLTDDIVLTSISSYVDHKVRQTLDVDAVSIQAFQYRQSGSVKSFTQEVRLAGGEGSSFRWVLGGNAEHTKSFEETSQEYGQATIANTLGVRSGGQSAANKMRNYAIFANGEYDIIPDLTLKIGGRYTTSKRDADICAFDTGDGISAAFLTGFARSLNPGVAIPAIQVGQCYTLGPDRLPARFLDTLKENNFSWRVGLDYKPSRDLLLYANIAKGYKAGSYPITGALIYTAFLPVVQESLLDYEAGFKTKLFDRKLGLNGAVFYYDYGNKQLLTKLRDPLVGLISALDNIPKSRVKGAELELTAAPVEGLRLTGGMTYLDAKITKYTGINAAGTLADFAGTPIPFTPKWQFLAGADYDIPVEGNIRPFVGATLTKRTGTGSIVGTAEGTVVRPGFRSLVPLADAYQLPGYTLLDLRAGITAEDGSWRLMVWGKNVTNKYYWQNVVTVNDVVTRYAGQPATYGVTFSHKFQ